MRRSFFAVALVAAAARVCMTTEPSTAQSFSVLHTFAPGAIQRLGLILTNADGASPAVGLAVSGSTLYGSAKNGGTTGSGTLFSIDTNGSGFNMIYTFSSDLTNNFDGANPNGPLTLANGTLYGTTSAGGNTDAGVIFALSTNPLTFSNLYTFSAPNSSTGFNSDGANPAAGLLLSGATLFGTTSAGGTGASGTLFAIGTEGGSFKVLHQFSALDSTTGTNNDGASPFNRLTLSGSTLFGTTSAGGSAGYGTLFAIQTDGTGFTVLHNFDTNGGKPVAELVLSGGTLYGLASTAAFSVNTNGTGYTVLHQFNSQVDFVSTATPGLTLISNTFFGAAAGGGASGSGDIFSMFATGGGFTSQYDFTKESGPFPGTNSDGAFPNGGLVSLNGNLYGTTGEGGTSGNGVVFSLTPTAVAQTIPPLLSAQLSAGNFVLSFQTVSGQTYSVQQIADLTSANWIPLTNFVANGAPAQFTIPIAGPYQFFRVLTQ